jgi:hypothetical protein
MSSNQANQRMKERVSATAWMAGGLLLAGFAATAQTNQWARRSAEKEPDYRNHFGISYRVGWNMKANFRNLGSGNAVFPGPALSGVPHTYDNGYVLVDKSGNANGETWNWGCQGSSQVVGDYVLLSASTPGQYASGVDGGPQHGLELTYTREFGCRWGCSWGLELAFGYTDLTFRNSATMSGGVLTVDAYSLEGGPAPVAPHEGTFEGPGPVISDTPLRQPASVDSCLRGTLFGIRLGPTATIPLSKRCSLVFGGGFAVGIVDAEFSYRQSGTVALAAMARGSRTQMLPGAYLSATLNVRLSRSLTLFAGAQFLYLDRYSQTVGDKRVELNLDKTFFVTAGLNWSF